MFFFLSKTLNYLVLPLTIVVIFLVLSVIIKRQPWKRRFFWTGFVLLLFFSNDFIANSIMRAWEIDATPYSSLQPRELGVVLTGTTHSFQEPNDRVYFKRGADRVTHTIQLYKLGLIKKILISGGSGRLLKEDEPEANKFQKVMLMAGVDEQDILLENKTRNTYESAVAVSQMLDSLQLNQTDCLLITSAFHMRRSLACYRKAGLDIEPFTTDFYGLQDKLFLPSFLLPSMEGFIIWEKLLKEWTGFVAYKVAGYL
jgi:uncharacterized SAM-binding protein YcdF (DUF218 family)